MSMYVLSNTVMIWFVLKIDNMFSFEMGRKFQLNIKTAGFHETTK